MGERARILAVDDDETIRRVLIAILEENDYSVNTAETGKEAIEKTNASFYNLALIDFRLPDMDGTELPTALRETTPGKVKIIKTGYPSLQNRQASRFVYSNYGLDSSQKLLSPDNAAHSFILPEGESIFGVQSTG